MRKTKRKAIIAFILIFIIVTAIIPLNVKANGDGNNTGNEVVDNNQNNPQGNIVNNPVDNNNNNNDANSYIDVTFATMTVSGNTATFEVDNANITATVEGANIEDNKVRVHRNNLGNVTFAISDNFNSETMVVMIRGMQNYSTSLAISDGRASLQGLKIPDGGIQFSIENKSAAQPGQPGQPEPPTIGGPDDIQFDVKFTDTYINMWINRKTVISDETGEFKNEFTGTITGAGYNGEGDINELTFIQVFGEPPVNEYTINGVKYKKGDINVTISDEAWIIKVPAASSYVVRGEGDKDFPVPRTIIWTNPNYVPKNEEDMKWVEGFSLDHGYANIVAIYDENGQQIDEKYWDGQLAEDGFGHYVVAPGCKVVFEFVPEYGYQLTDIRINEQKLGLTGLENQFEFVMPNTNIHFDAEFTKTEDIVKANSEKVSSGTVSLGKNTLNGGTAQLTVNDIELSADKIKGFENAAGDYKVSNYLDIDLYQVFYKGKNDSDDVWSNKIDELDNEVTISIKLEDGINADDIVLVHNIHNGEEYEVIKIDSYDAKTNTITFKTKSFSNYAIATKGEVVAKEENKENSPQSGDTIRVIVAVLVVAVVGLGISFIVKRNKK